MELMKFICPGSQYVWNRYGVSECFDNLVIGFGVNLLTVVMVVVLLITNRPPRQWRVCVRANMSCLLPRRLKFLFCMVLVQKNQNAMELRKFAVLATRFALITAIVGPRFETCLNFVL